MVVSGRRKAFSNLYSTEPNRCGSHDPTHYSLPKISKFHSDKIMDRHLRDQERLLGDTLRAKTIMKTEMAAIMDLFIMLVASRLL